jgi:hypothetical protein
MQRTGKIEGYWVDFKGKRTDNWWFITGKITDNLKLIRREKYLHFETKNRRIMAGKMQKLWRKNKIKCLKHLGKLG